MSFNSLLRTVSLRGFLAPGSLETAPWLTAIVWAFVIAGHISLIIIFQCHKPSPTQPDLFTSSIHRRQLYWYARSQLPPNPTPCCKHVRPHVFKPTRLDHEFFPSLSAFWNSGLTPGGKFMRVRVSSLEEACKGACESVVDDGVSLLDRVHLIPLRRKERTVRQPSVCGLGCTYVYSVAGMFRGRDAVFAHIRFLMGCLGHPIRRASQHGVPID